MDKTSPINNETEDAIDRRPENAVQQLDVNVAHARHYFIRRDDAEPQRKLISGRAVEKCRH